MRLAGKKQKTNTALQAQTKQQVKFKEDMTWVYLYCSNTPQVTAALHFYTAVFAEDREPSVCLLEIM